MIGRPTGARVDDMTVPFAVVEKSLADLIPMCRVLGLSAEM